VPATTGDFGLDGDTVAITPFAGSTARRAHSFSVNDLRLIRRLLQRPPECRERTASRGTPRGVDPL
jgi:hypothetical protein